MQHASVLAYDLSFAQHGQNLVHVKLLVPKALLAPEEGAAGYFVDLFMPVWTPGSYLVREFARQLQDVVAHDVTGRPLTMRKISKNSWRIVAEEATDVRVSYAVWGREMAVRSNCIEQDFALLQGPATYLGVSPGHLGPHVVRLHLPDAYDDVVCGLPILQERRVATLEAPNFDVLVDTPIALGRPNLQHFEVQGIKHTLATWGADKLFDCQRAAMDLRRIVEATSAMFGTIPYARYVMINVLMGGQGGLEHADSSVIMASPMVMRSQASYAGFLGLMAHEHFHAWNIKRMRPKALGPFDYHRENHSESLWVAEGITAFYDNVMVARAGLIDTKTYLDLINADCARLHATPGRLKQSLAQASFDAWIKFYRRDENTDNTAVSYYLKGSIVAMVLHAELLLHSDGAVSLDDVMRTAFGRFSGATGFSEQEFRDCVTDVCPNLPKGFLQRAIDTTAELNFDNLCQVMGLVPLQDDADPKTHKDKPKVYLGMRTKEHEGRLVVSQVVDLGPASRACLQADDEIIAIDGLRMTAAALGDWLQLAEPRQEVTVLASRYGRLRTVMLTPDAVPQAVVQFAWHKQPTPMQERARSRWLGAAAQRVPHETGMTSAGGCL